MSIRPTRLPRASENQRLRSRLMELEETLRAIRSGEVDGLVVETSGKTQVFTLNGADQTYRLMVELMQKGAATLSHEGLVLYCNPFLAALLGLPLDRVLGVPLTRFLDEPTGLVFGALLKGALSGVSRGEISFLGSHRTVLTQVSITVLPIDGGLVYCMIVTDLTERKRREEERLLLAHEQTARAAAEDSNRAARVEIARRTLVEESLLQAEMDRTQLLERERMARRDADEANRLKDEFLATLSHELRTPLSAIMTWSHVLRQKGLDSATVQRAHDAIERNAKAQTALVADLLDVSRIVTGKFHMTLGLVSLAEVIELAVETIRPAISAKAIDLKIVLEPGVGPVLGDAARLRQVVWNLVSNAIRFAPASSRVTIRVSSTPTNVHMSVSDEGVGIDPSFLPFVFDRFRQADSSSTRSHAGLGLGLAMVRHLIEMHGGTVWAQNREDRDGAVFTISLPIPPAVPVPPLRGVLSPVPESSPSSTAPLPLHGLKVLLVDDQADSREAMAIAIGHLGASVTTASAAWEALQMLMRDRPDVLVADIGMPTHDGHALARWIRSLPEESGGMTPTIALTAFAGERDRVDALRSGFHLYLTQPATPAQLAAAIASLVRATPSALVPQGLRLSSGLGGESHPGGHGSTLLDGQRVRAL